MVSQSYDHEDDYLFQRNADRLRDIAITLKKFRWFEWLFFVIGASSTLLALFSVAVTGLGKLSQSRSDTALSQWFYEGGEAAFGGFIAPLFGLAPSIVFASMILMIVLVVIHSSMERDGDSYVSEIVWKLRNREVSNGSAAGNGLRPQIQSLIQKYKEVSRPLFFAHGIMSVRSSLLMASFLFIAVLDLLLN